MRSNKKFIVPFEGLKNEKHSFKFHVTTAFFEELPYSIIQGGDILVDFTLDKRESMMIGQFEMSGTVQMPCDRCTELMNLPLSVSHQIIYTFGEEESDDENLIIIPFSEFKLDIAPVIYELLTVALPNRTIHNKNECNQEMLDLLNQYGGSIKQTISPQEEEIDPRWDKLKKLK